MYERRYFLKSKCLNYIVGSQEISLVLVPYVIEKSFTYKLCPHN